MTFIDAHRECWRVEPICKAPQVAPSTYYAAISRQVSARAQRDEQLKIEIARVHREHFGVYGIEKVWHQLTREGIQVGRDRVARLMAEMDLEGVVRGIGKRRRLVALETDLVAPAGGESVKAGPASTDPGRGPARARPSGPPRVA